MMFSPLFQEPEQCWQDVTQTLRANILASNDWQNLLKISITPLPPQFYEQNVYTFPVASVV